MTTAIHGHSDGGRQFGTGSESHPYRVYDRQRRLAAAAAAWPFLTAAALLLALSGCGDRLRREDERRPTPMIQGHLHTTASLVETDRGRTVTLHAGETVAVRLEACGGCPFVWVQAEKLVGGVVALVGEALERSLAVPEGDAGAGGFDVFVYKGLKPGEQVLRFFYSDGKSRIDKEVDYRVVVR